MTNHMTAIPIATRMTAAAARAALATATEIKRFGDGVGGIEATAVDVLEALRSRRAEITFYAGGTAPDGTRYAPSVAVLPYPPRYRHDPRGSDTRFCFKIRMA